MIKGSLILLSSVFFWTGFHSIQGYAKIARQCVLWMPAYTKLITKNNLDDLPIYITAKNVTGKYPYFINYKNDVDIQYGKQNIKADEVKLTQTEITNHELIRTIIATGNVRYNSSQIILNGAKAWLNLNNKDIDIENSHYSIVGCQVRGCADKIKIRNMGSCNILKNGTFTTCPRDNESWSIVGSKIILDQEEKVAKIWGARFRIANVPIFYTPYLQLPIGDKRNSGFLLPTFNYSKELNFTFPFYWNIAPNYDLTITPQFIAFRGIKLNNEFRYLTAVGAGTIALDWLKHDHNHIKNKNISKYKTTCNSRDRWLLHWKHSAILNQVWHYNIDCTKVSDLKYFTDFSSKYGNSTDLYVTQKINVGYTQPNWRAVLTHKQFQILVDYPNNQTYKINPQLDFNYYKNDFGAFNLKTCLQVARIISTKPNNPSATRLHVEPELNLLLSNNWLSISNTIKIMATYYNQDIPANLTNSNLRKQVSRILPSLTFDATTAFRHYLLINGNYIQTLEPRIQYFYIPYRDQSNINNYDSSLLQTDYNGLFRNRIYSGLDCIAPANQSTTGITTRIYDKNLTELFNFSIGQIYSFKNPRVTSFNSLIKNKNLFGSLLWVGNAYLRLSDNFELHGGFQYDRLLGNITTGNIATKCSLNSNRLVQLNYRFVDHNYIQLTNNKNIPADQKGISQIGAVVSWSLDDQLEFTGSYYYNLKEKQPVSRSIGLQYNAYCWSINIGYEHKITGWKQQNFSSNCNNSWSINIQLKGLNNNSNLKNQQICLP